MLRKIQYEEFLRQLPGESRDAVVRWWNTPGTRALVYFENTAPGHKGEASVLAVGPQRRVKNLDAVEGTHLEELPELRQYPSFYCEKEPEAASRASSTPRAAAAGGRRAEPPRDH